MARRRRARFWSFGPPQAGSISESCQVGQPQAGSISESCQVWPAAGGLDFGVLARRRRARFLRTVKCGPPQAGSVFTNSFKELGFVIVLKYPLTSTYSDL